MDFTILISQLAGGIAGSTAALGCSARLSLGWTGSVLAGLVGGGLGGQILGAAFGNAHVAASTGLNAGILLSDAVSGAAGGAALALIVAGLRRAFDG